MKKIVLFTVVILLIFMGGCFGRTEYSELSSLNSMDIPDEDVDTFDTTTQAIDATQKTSGTTSRCEEDRNSVDNEVDLDAFFGTTTTRTTKKVTATEQKTTTSQNEIVPFDKTTTTSAQEGTQPTSALKLQLPAIGYDPDGKGRINVKNTSVSGYTVSIELENVSTKWMTEETTMMECTCYNEDGGVEKKEQISVGAIEVEKNKVFYLQITENTTEVKITDFKTTYWSQWK